MMITNNMQSSWITFHHFIFRDLFFVFFASRVSSKDSGQIMMCKFWGNYTLIDSAKLEINFVIITSQNFQGII